MSTFKPEEIRNIAVIAHGGAGKTTLIETLLFQAHEISSRSKDGAVMRVEPEEVSHRLAITPHIAHLTWNGVTVNIIDTPGYFNFLESTRGVLPGVDGVVVVVSGTEGVKPETERLWSMIAEAQIPALIFVNHMDAAEADLMSVLHSVKDRLAVVPEPLTIPIRAGANIIGIVDLMRNKAWATRDGRSSPLDIPEAMLGDVRSLRTELIEKIAESDDALLGKYLEGEELSPAELEGALQQCVVRRQLVPVLCGSALANSGIDALIESIVHYLPSPNARDEARPFRGEGEQNAPTRCCDPAAPFSAIVLKTTIDPFSGKLSVVRVVSGSVRANQQIYNATQESKQKSGHIYLLQGKELQAVDQLTAGQIGAIAKLEDTHTGDTVCDPSSVVRFGSVKYADPPVSYAVESEDVRADEKVAAGLAKLADEDPTLHVTRDAETHQMILSGMGQTHIEIALERLTRKFGGRAKLTAPRVPYRETIRRAVKVQGKLKKQTGGHGQFANCWLEVAPLPRNSGFEFVDAVKGGVIPRQYIPSIRKGVQDAMLKGALRGYPVTDVRVTVYDGSFHDVDSSDYAFQVAGSLGFQAAMEEGNTLILEPIMALDIFVPERSTGDVLKDLSSRRGRIIGMNSSGTQNEIEAEVPMSETLDYGNVLSSLTAGQGVYTMSVAHYRELPQQLEQKVAGNGVATHSAA